MKTLQITLAFEGDRSPITGMQVPIFLFRKDGGEDGLAYLFDANVIRARGTQAKKRGVSSTLTITVSQHSHLDNFITQEEVIARMQVELDVFLRESKDMEISAPAIPSALFILQRTSRLHKEYKDVIDFIQHTELYPGNWKLLTLAPALNKLGNTTITNLAEVGISTLGQLMEHHHWNEGQHLKYMKPRTVHISKIEIIETLRLLASFYHHEGLSDFIIQLTGARPFEASSSIATMPPNAAPINSGLVSSLGSGALSVNTQASASVSQLSQLMYDNQALQNEIIQLNAMMNKSFSANKAYVRILSALLGAYQQHGVATDYLQEVTREINAEIMRAEGTDALVEISQLDNMLQNLAQGRGPSNNSAAGFQPTLFSPAPEGDRDLNGEQQVARYFNP